MNPQPEEGDTAPHSSAEPWSSSVALGNPLPPQATHTTQELASYVNGNLKSLGLIQRT